MGWLFGSRLGPVASNFTVLNNALHLCLKRGKMGCSVSSFNYSALRVTDASRVRCMTAFRLKSHAVPLEIVFKSS